MPVPVYRPLLIKSAVERKRKSAFASKSKREKSGEPRRRSVPKLKKN